MNCFFCCNGVDNKNFCAACLTRIIHKIHSLDIVVGNSTTKKQIKDYLEANQMCACFEIHNGIIINRDSSIYLTNWDHLLDDIRYFPMPGVYIKYIDLSFQIENTCVWNCL